MRKINAIVDLECLAVAEAKGGAGEISKTVNRQAGRFFKSGNEKRRCEMSEVMFDMMNGRFQFHAVLLLEGGLNGGGASDVLDFLQRQLRMRPMVQDKSHPPPVVHPGLAFDRDMIDIAPAQPAFMQTV